MEAGITFQKNKLRSRFSVS